MAATEPVLVPVSHLGGRLDNDSPTYVFAPDLYLTLALAYDSMAAPAARQGADGVRQPDFAAMQPRLAVGWTEEPSGDWVVELREGVRSPAGNEWRAEALAWTFEKSFAQGVMADWRWRGVVGVEEVEVLDSRRVRFHMRAPYPTFPNWLLSVSPNMVDAAAVREHASAADPWGLEWLDANAAGFGAYRLERMDLEGLRFLARPEHWQGEPEATRIDVVPWRAGRRDAIAQLEEARPVAVVGLDPDETAALLGREDLRVVRTWAGHVSVEIDFTAAPFDDQAVRHALAFATPYEQLRADGLRGLARPWVSPVKGMSQWYLDEPLPYGHDPRRARELLAAAGHAGGIEADLYVSAQPYCARMGEILAAAWREAGIEVTLRPERELPAGRLPVLFLRAECGHNTSEPIYDIAHDYAAMNPLLPLPGGPPHVGNWRPRWRKNPAAIAEFMQMLAERDIARKRARFDDLQRHLVELGTSVFIGEMQQTLVANRHVPESLLAPESRFFQALSYQNATTGYLPPHGT
jgi:peptide/nickel transport system substrate-binding protein